MDDSVYTAYQETIMPILEEQQKQYASKKKMTLEEFEQVKDFLLSPAASYEEPFRNDDDDDTDIAYRHQLAARKEQFLENTQWNEKQYELALRCLTTLISTCAKTKTVPPVVTAWSKIQSSGMILRPNFLSTLLFVAGLDENRRDLAVQIATSHDLLYGATESSIFLRIQQLVVTNGDPAGAETLLRKVNDSAKRLRTFLPLLEHYCDKGDVESILRVLELIRAAPGAHINSQTYTLLIGALARNHVFGLSTPNSQQQYGPQLLDKILGYMGEDSLEIAQEDAVKLYHDFQVGFQQSFVPGTSDNIPSATNAVDGWAMADAEKGVQLFLGRVLVDPISSQCPCTGATLRLFTLDDEHRQIMRDSLFDMAEAQQVEFNAAKKANKRNKQQSDKDKPGQAKEELGKFENWLQTREGEPFTAFVDGANVAYFGQNKVRYSQVQKVVEELERMGERPLVIMPRKYVSSTFRLSHGMVQQLRTDELEVISNLINTKKMYIVPAQCFDDYYWMLASVTKQQGAMAIQNNNNSSNATDSSVLPGIRPILVSNDQMRDHKLELLEPQLFRRWFSSHIVTYSIAHFQENEWEDRTIQFAAADSFSCEIQGNPIDRTGMTGTAWHLPVSEWEPRNSRFCIAVAYPPGSTIG